MNWIIQLDSCLILKILKTWSEKDKINLELDMAFIFIDSIFSIQVQKSETKKLPREPGVPPFAWHGSQKGLRLPLWKWINVKQNSRMKLFEELSEELLIFLFTFWDENRRWWFVPLREQINKDWAFCISDTDTKFCFIIDKLLQHVFLSFSFPSKLTNS